MWDIKPPKQFYWTHQDWAFYRLLIMLKIQKGMGGMVDGRAYLIVPNWDKPSKSHIVREGVSNDQVHSSSMEVAQ